MCCYPIQILDGNHSWTFWMIYLVCVIFNRALESSNPAPHKNSNQLANPYILTPFFFSSSSDASMNMANMTYATSSPAATTGGQGSGPVSVEICPYIKKLLSRAVLSLGSYRMSWRHSIRAPAFSLSLSTQISHNLIILFLFPTSIPS